MKQDSRALSRPFLYFIFAISILGFIFAVVLVAMLVAYGYIGFNTNSSGTVGTCLDNYFISKYNAYLQNIYGAVFVCSVLALVFSVIIFVILLLWVIRVCKGGSPIGSTSRKSKIALYVLASCFVLMAIIPMGYHVTYLVELGNCSGNANSSTDLLVLLAIAVLLFVFALLLWILLLCAYCKDSDADEKYREVESQPTEQNQRVSQKRKEPVNYRKKPEVYEKQQMQRSPKHKVEKVEETKDNLFESPKRPTQNVYAKEPNQHETLHPASYSKYQSPSKNPPPYLEPKRRIPEENNLSFIPSKVNYKEPQQQLVYSKPRRDVIAREDDDSLHKEEKRYLSKYGGGSILPSSGVEEKYGNNSRLASDYFRSPDPSRRQLGSSPPRKSDRDGILINHIRGKYAR